MRRRSNGVVVWTSMVISRDQEDDHRHRPGLVGLFMMIIVWIVLDGRWWGDMDGA